MDEHNQRNTGVSWRNNFIELEQHYQILEEENKQLKLRLEAAQNQYPQLLAGFLETMNEIGAYGEQKHKALSFQAMAKRGDYVRHDRDTPAQIMKHIKQHSYEYAYDIKHDHFKTLKHQLAAIAFNAMMEYHFARLEDEGKIELKEDK